MIDGYKVFVCSFVSNSVTTGYGPMIAPAVNSWCDVSYVDRVVLVDGMSDDDTRLLVPADRKVSIVDGPRWPVDSWSWRNVIDAENTFVQAVLDDPHPRKVFAYMSIDNVLYRDHADLAAMSRRMIKDDFDFVMMRFDKAFTPAYITTDYPVMPSKNWYICTATRVDERFKPTKIINECAIDYEKAGKIRGTTHRFKSAPVSYDMFFFTREHVEAKAQRHVGFQNMKRKPTISELVDKQMSKLRKRGIKLRKVLIEQHPERMHDVLQNTLSAEHYGYSMFGLVEGATNGLKIV